jgi:hypothetical protein
MASMILGQASESPPRLGPLGKGTAAVLYRLEPAWDR